MMSGWANHIEPTRGTRLFLRIPENRYIQYKMLRDRTLIHSQFDFP